MKKFLKVMVALVLALAIIGGVTFLVDASRVTSGKTPLCAVKMACKDPTLVEYYGLGYKVMERQLSNGVSATTIGSWFMKSEDLQEVTQKNNEPKEEVITNEQEMQNLEETSNEPTEVGEENPLNEQQEENTNMEETTNAENQETETPETEVQNEEIVSQTNEEQPSMNSFLATIVGVNQNSIVVSADEAEPIRASSDMFSFSNPNMDASYTVGQRIRVFYTGNINESYPAQIEATQIEVIE